MGLKKVDPAKRKQEEEIAKELFSYIDEKQSLVFNAGAGAGKTYALIESLRYVIKKYGQILEENNQQIMCITYTNVAAKHIKDQLGNSRRVVVSTIHERLWQLIASYQEQLLPIHKEKVEAELTKDLFILTEDIKEERTFRAYRELSEEDRRKFEEAVWEHREEFYQGYGLNAASFRDFYKIYIPDYMQLMSSVGNFKKIVTKIYAIRRNRECLAKMESKERGYRKVEYNARYNQDRLYRMRISHDTLIEYSKKMVVQYPGLQQIIIDRYPYILSTNIRILLKR